MPNFCNIKLGRTRRDQAFTMDDWFVWGGGLVEEADGLTLYFECWPQAATFKGWVTHGRIWRAKAETAFGPFHPVGEVPLLGAETGLSAAFNPMPVSFEGKTYVFFTGTASSADYWSARNSQRVGVAVYDGSALVDVRRPLIDVSHTAGALMTSNPSAIITKNGEWVLVFKQVAEGEAPKGGRVSIGLARARSPFGPYQVEPEPILGQAGHSFSFEDPFLFADGEGASLLVKDMNGEISGRKGGIVQFHSDDFTHWRQTGSIVVNREIHWGDEDREAPDRLERPFLFRDAPGSGVLLLAAKWAERSALLPAAAVIAPAPLSSD